MRNAIAYNYTVLLQVLMETLTIQNLDNWLASRLQKRASDRAFTFFHQTLPLNLDNH